MRSFGCWLSDLVGLADCALLLGFLIAKNVYIIHMTLFPGYQKKPNNQPSIKQNQTNQVNNIISLKTHLYLKGVEGKVGYLPPENVPRQSWMWFCG